MIDSTGIIQAFNAPACKLLGYELGEVIGKNVVLIIPPGEDKVNHDKYLKRYMESKKSKIIGLGRKVKVVKKGGDMLACKLWVSEKSNENQTPFFTGILEPVE